MPADPASTQKPYEISTKQVIVAFAIEGIIIAASLFGNYSLIPNPESLTWALLITYMAAPIAYAATEVARVPLALATRTQTTFIPRFLAIFGLIFAAGITTKSMVSLGERMYHPRQMEVLHAHQDLKRKQSDLASIAGRVAALDADVEQRSTELATGDQRLKDSNAELGRLPPQKTVQGTARNSRGQSYKTYRTITDPRTAVMAENLKRAQTDRNEASQRLDQARAARAAVDPAEAEKAVTDAQAVYREAVLNSQLHALTAMVLAKDPTEVTDGEVYGFLRYFVFAAALCVAFASSLLAITAVRRIKPTYEFTEEDGSYILGPYARTIYENAATVARDEARRASTPTVVPQVPAVRPSTTPAVA